MITNIKTNWYGLEKAKLEKAIRKELDIKPGAIAFEETMADMLDPAMKRDDGRTGKGCRKTIIQRKTQTEGFKFRKDS